MHGLAFLLVFLSALEFILAQAPRSMQGLLIGLWYAWYSVKMLLTIMSYVAFRHNYRQYWPSLLRVVLSIVSLLLFLVVSSCYRRRRRQEPSTINQHIIVEEYTERALGRHDDKDIDVHSYLIDSCVIND